MTRVLFGILVFILFCAGVTLLQIFLSKRESKWPGLILPAMTLFFSLLAVFGMSAYYTYTTESVQNGNAIQNVVNNHPNLVTTLYVFILYNIPTVILLGNYFACREKRKKNKEIEKMNIQDLE